MNTLTPAAHAGHHPADQPGTAGPSAALTIGVCAAFLIVVLLVAAWWTWGPRLKGRRGSTKD